MAGFPDEEFLSALLEPAVVLDPDGAILYANPAMEALLGRDAGDLAGEQLASLPVGTTTPQELELVRAGEESPQVTRVLLRLFDVAWRGAPARLALMHDLADYRERERVSREALRRRDEFLACLSHELRNPLGAIRSSIMVLAEAAPRARRDDLTWVVEVLERQSGVMSRLLDDLLDLTRVASDRVKLDVEPLRLGAFVRRHLEGMRVVDEGDDERCVTELQVHSDGWVVADPARMTQILENLLRNVGRYGGGFAQVTVRTLDDRAELRVRDRGIGLAPEHLEEVFLPFRQVEANRSGTRGLGLGLSLVRRLAELQGGTAWAESDGLGHGASFVVSLPRAREAEPRPRSRPDDGVAVGAAGGDEQGPEILLVDDEPDGRRLLALLLQRTGFVVAQCSSGPEALERVRSGGPPDVAILDIAMPQMNGYVLARRLRSELGDACPLLISLTGYGQPEDHAASRRNGFAHHLTKPVDPDQLVRLVRDAVVRRNA